MNKGLKRILFTTVLAAFVTANAQQAAPAAHAPEAHAPAAEASAVSTQETVSAAPHVPSEAPAAQATAAEPAAQAPVAEAPAVVEPAVPAPVVEAVTVTESVTTVTEAVVIAETAKADSASVAPTTDSAVVILVVEETQLKKKKRRTRGSKNDLTIVDIPANFEIQARKIMPVDSELGDDNLDTWWGRANLMVLTESDNFVGKIHLRMYPGESVGEAQDRFQLYEAWAWHRGDYVNIKVGRWDNTTRFGSMTFGGYIDSKKDKNNNLPRGNDNIVRASGFMSTYNPENALQFGLNNFSENISLDVALISSDNHLNKGDLRAYFAFKELAGLERMSIGLGYRSNVFDEIYNSRNDVTHTVSAGFSAPIVSDVGILKNLTFFFEAALIGLDDQTGEACEGGPCETVPANYRYDKNDPTININQNNPIAPVLCGLDIELYQGLDKIVLEAEYQAKRRNAITGGKEHVKDVQGSIYVQKKLNDRFTLNMGIQSENNVKDFSFAGRLQGRIN